MNICNALADLVLYGKTKQLIEEGDETYIVNQLLKEMKLTDYAPDRTAVERPLEEILKELLDDATERGVIEDGVVFRDLFDTALMGILTPRPSVVRKKFFEDYAESPVKATDHYYQFSRDTDYIRTYRVAKDKKWKYTGKYGEIDITINLSKPEKDPKAIAMALKQKAAGYPKCALCPENEGFAGSLNQAARENHRIIPVTVAGKQWYLQYSPYVYYNEHCIVFSGEHTPMKIDRNTFEKQLDFVTLFPHYFLGSNADLPIVGGSILTHDHMQGGHYEFAMERAGIEIPLTFKGYPTVHGGIVHWPMSVIRLTCPEKAPLVDLSDKILGAWRGYTDKDAFIFAETDGVKHNTITPIGRRRGEEYELDLVLRNNITTDEHPMGVYHPHADKHNIKKENIGLIEVMGLAVLPARLKKEMALVAEALVNGKDLKADEETAKHAEWVAKFIGNYKVTKDNVNEILEKEVGKTFEAVLEDAGVYPCTEKGRADFLKFVKTLDA